MSEVAAAMGLTGLENIDTFIKTNYRNYKHYQAEMSDIPGLKLITYDETETNNYQYIILEINDEITQVSRDQLVEILKAEYVLARRYFNPGCHQMEPYRSYFPHAGLLLPETERLSKQALSLPTGTAIGPDEISKICQVIRLAITQGSDVQTRLQARRDAVPHPYIAQAYLVKEPDKKGK